MAPSPRTTLLLLALLWLFFSQDSSQPTSSSSPTSPRSSALHNPSSRAHAVTPEDIIARETAALDALGSSTYGDFDPARGRWVNVTGLREEDKGVLPWWGRLGDVRTRVGEQRVRVLGKETAGRTLEGGYFGWGKGRQDGGEGEGAGKADQEGGGQEELVLWRNVSGWVRGSWIRVNGFEDTGLGEGGKAVLGGNSSGYAAGQAYTRNVTGHEGKMSLSFTERDTGQKQVRLGEEEEDGDAVRGIAADISIFDETASGEGWKAKMYGVHYLDTGAIMLATTSEKFAGIFALPHFALSNYTFGAARGVLNRTISHATEKQRRASEREFVGNPWTSVVEGGGGGGEDAAAERAH
ncbi:hypothetical protein LTS18_010625, partial [Coniosporium uncinatum]